MYKLLLCARYLKTRYLAFICIVSVMLGVATLIVVNAVMSGFSTKLKDRLHGVLSDVVVDTDRMGGFVETDRAGNPIYQRDKDGNVVYDSDNNPLAVPLDPKVAVERIMHGPAGSKIAAISPTIEVFAILQFSFRGQTMTKPVRLIGVDPASRTAVGGFREYLHRQHDSAAPNFDLTQAALDRHEDNRLVRERAALLNAAREVPNAPPPKPLLPVAPMIPEPDLGAMTDGMPKPKLYGAITGYSIAHFRFKDEHGRTVEEAALKPGDAINITTVGGQQLRPVFGSFLVTDYLKTEMSEYDQSFVYVPLDHLQRIRGMEGSCTAFQIRLHNYDRDKESVGEALREVFPPQTGARVATWEEHQGPLLSAIEVEKSILNLLLFMIIGVAGFSVLAIFTMIVSEKYRDIGILKSLGASNRGVMSIFVGYGLLLGSVGCAFGTVLGLWFTRNINEIEAFLTRVTGKAVFPRDVYYFKEIPTNVDPVSVLMVNVGAAAIAVVFSLLPAWRAARLHPVRAPRSE